MKKIKSIYLFSVLLIAFCSFISCDEIAESDYLKPIENSDWLGQRVLIEDFTGMNCTNCPDASRIAHGLQELYSGKVIIIAEHINRSVSRTLGSPDSMTCRAGYDYADKYADKGKASLPTGMINRKNSSSTSKLYDRGVWAEETYKQLFVEPTFNLDIKNTFNVSSRELKINVSATPLKNMDVNYNLVVLITESDIIAYQAGSIEGDNYKHQHVLRTSVSSSAGDSFISGLVSKGFSVTKQYNIIIPQRWVGGGLEPKAGGLAVPENCSVVAFISDPSDDTIIQVAEAKVVN